MSIAITAQIYNGSGPVNGLADDPEITIRRGDTGAVVAGPSDIAEPDDPWGSYEGRKGAKLAVYSRSDGKQVTVFDLPAVPVYDGMSAADKRLFISFEDGTIRCFAGTK